MGISAVGQQVNVAALRKAAATILVFAALFFYLYGPPLVPAWADSARDSCNELTGDSSRNFRIEWRTTTLSTISHPHWVCYDLGEPGSPSTSLGWWEGAA
jgi:hypothetical protein